MSTTATPTPTAIRLADYRPPAWLAEDVRLRFDIFEEHTLVECVVRYRLAEASASELPALHLDGVNLELVELTLDGEEPREAPRPEGERLTIQPSSAEFELRVVTRIDPGANKALEGLYRSGDVWCTQMEAEGFRRVTWFQDRPDVMAGYTTTVTADKARCPTLLANGNLLEQRDLDDGRHLVVWHDPHKKPCYLFALVAGNLEMVSDSFTTCSGREVKLELYVDPGNTGRAPHAMASLKRAMKWDEERFGREYDLDIFMIVAVNDFNMGAMENKGLNIFNAAAVLCDEASSTDDDFHRIEAIVGHEYFHNWSGNRVTCRDWFQLSLKEGFTVYRDQEFSSDLHNRDVQRIDDVRNLRAMQFPEDAGPMAHPVRPSQYLTIDNFYTMTIYEKGSELIRMMATVLGREAFRAGSDLYFERHDGQAVTTQEFVAALQDASGRDLSGFSGWYEQAGTPELRATGSWDEAAGSYELTLEQHTPDTPGQTDKRAVLIPVSMGLIGPDGADMPLRLADESAPSGTSLVLELTEQRQSWRFVGLSARPVPSLLRGFSAPVKLVLEQTDAELAFLAQHDSDAFNRWEAAQRLATRTLLDLTARAARGEDLELPSIFRDTWDALLDDTSLDPAFAALALRLPLLIELSEAVEVFQPEPMEAALRCVRRAWGSHAAPRLAARREALRAKQDGDQAAQRALANTCLSWWTASGEEAALDACIEQHRNADNMTDAQAALERLCQLEDPRRDEALASFLERWQHDTLVMNKWFAVQASSLRPGVIDDVRALAQHPAFDDGNPNHLRSLYRVFGRNLLRFHAADGAGYTLLADMIAEVDGKNPVLSGRMATLFLSWKRLDPARQALVKIQLQRLLELPGVSRNLYEVTSQALA